MDKQLSDILTAIQPLAAAVNQHPVFTEINSISRLCRFAEIHVYAVWDFMCLLKALQRRLSSPELLWTPPLNHLGCHLVNALLAEEESDVFNEKQYLSHFELYLRAMQECGADIGSISTFITHIRQQRSLHIAFSSSDVPLPAQHFVADTFAIIAKNSHHMAASLAFAREHITSGMFSNLLNHLNTTDQHSLNSFIQYFQRHIELDGGKHGHQSQLLVADLCGDDENKWREAAETAIFSLQSRLRLLDEIHAVLLL